VVSPTFAVTAYRTLWFGLQYDSETIEQGERVGRRQEVRIPTGESPFEEARLGQS